MTPAVTETKRPIAHRCRHNHDTGIVVPPSDRKTPSAVLSLTAEINFTIKKHQHRVWLRGLCCQPFMLGDRLRKLSSGNRVSGSNQVCAALGYLDARF